MILRQAQPTLYKPPRRDQGSGEHDPAKLSAKLRELAVRAHHLVRATDASESEPRLGEDQDIASDRERELKKVHAQIVQLQRNLHAQNLNGVATYVSALRQRVEEYLA
ncbi:MAG: hypothetical protein ACHRXM_02855 [Isosphaerales bacterium]